MSLALNNWAQINNIATKFYWNRKSTLLENVFALLQTLSMTADELIRCSLLHILFLPFHLKSRSVPRLSIRSCNIMNIFKLIAYFYLEYKVTRLTGIQMTDSSTGMEICL